MRGPLLPPTAAGPVAALLSGYRVAHLLPGRVRLRPVGRAPARDHLLAALAFLPEKDLDIHVSRRNGAVLLVSGNPAAFAQILDLLRNAAGPVFPTPPARPQAQTHFAPSRRDAAVPARRAETAEPRNPLPAKILTTIAPGFMGAALAVLRAVPYILAGFKALLRGRLNLETLDATALLICIARRDFRALGSITFFFALGEYLAAKTRKRSRAGLADSLALSVDSAWVREGDLERRIPFAAVKSSDCLVCRAGAAIPADGTVVEGEGLVNEASLTGEPLSVHRKVGDSVYAGSVLEEGELLVRVRGVGGDTRIQAVLRTIEESESAKSLLQSRYERIADAVVPYNFLLAGLVFLLTRSPMRAGAVLLVDYSCAVRLAAPLTIFTAMREAVDHGVLIKGGRSLETVLAADVVVFDKTGTLTKARPELVKVVPFGRFSRSEVLRLAACLEEHFAHPVGKAVVYAAEKENLAHREEHAKVEYIAAHGIASRLREERVLLGSAHFVLEDEGVRLSAKQTAKVEAEAAQGFSVLHLAVGGKPAGLLVIRDEVRPEAREMLQRLRDDGVKRIIMLTGDGQTTAGAVAEAVGIDEFHAGLLPEGKAAFIRKLKAEGNTVMMVGDGLNDAPALSVADVGVAMKSGTDIAGEVADMLLLHDNLDGLLLTRVLARTALGRVRGNFRRSLFWNSLFLAGGLSGLIGPGLSAFLHNAATTAGAVAGIRPMLE